MGIQSDIFLAAFETSSQELGPEGQEESYKELEGILTGQGEEKIESDAGHNLIGSISVLTFYRPRADASDIFRRQELAKKIIDLIDTKSLPDAHHYAAFSGVINARGESLDPTIYLETIGRMIDVGFDPKKTDLSVDKDAFQVSAEQSGLGPRSNPVDVAVSILLLNRGQVNGIEGELAERAIAGINSGELLLRDIVMDGDRIRSFEERGEVIARVGALPKTEIELRASSPVETPKKSRACIIS
ncbi:MAG: hypothetical protein KGP29_04205 [Proteobacteria bacterium]|nr:hypothetical protein [Pseudomonadota bacterium]